MSVYEMAILVKYDLEALGKGGVYVSNIRPNVISPDETLIAIRKTTNTRWLARNDYYFMKYHPDGDFWTHKPGRTAILKYNHQPADKDWKQETIINSSGTAQKGNLTYNSEIYYIVFKWLEHTIFAFYDDSYTAMCLFLWEWTNAGLICRVA